MELLVGISLTAMIMGVALPQMANLKASYDKLNARSNFIKDLKRAQAESITQGCRGIVKIDVDAAGYSFGCDYLPYDEDADPDHDTQSFARSLPGHMHIASAAPIIFNSRGQAVDTSYIITNVTVTFDEWREGSYQEFASGTLLGTGVFSFD